VIGPGVGWRDRAHLERAVPATKHAAETHQQGLFALPLSPLRALQRWRDACNQEAMAFSAVLLAALATGSHCL
jgi:hypothetical protein